MNTNMKWNTKGNYGLMFWLYFKGIMEINWWEQVKNLWRTDRKTCIWCLYRRWRQLRIGNMLLLRCFTFTPMWQFLWSWFFEEVHLSECHLINHDNIFSVFSYSHKLIHNCYGVDSIKMQRTLNDIYMRLTYRINATLIYICSSISHSAPGRA